MTAPELQSYLHQKIPISRSLGVEVLDFSYEMVRIKAPFEPNINHEATIFGGSIACLLLLAGWSRVRFLSLDFEPLPRIVVQNSEVDYRNPVTGDFIACCIAPPEESVSAFARTYTKRKKSRINVEAYIEGDSNEKAALFQGRYVVFDKKK
jgi:thioesterase domain-containing protein